MEDSGGTPFGRYVLIELLGRGGMGEVWRAHDTDTDRVVALKVLPPHLAQDPDFAQRFRREAYAAARLNNPHIIPIHHYGEIDGRLYVDMRLIEGHDLQEVLNDGPLDPARAVRIIEQVAKALHAAHKIGLVHRDVKPSNVLIDEDDFAYLIDFGIARMLDETRLTSTGNAVGTFLYMAPERLGATQDDDARADIYALACVLYQCLTGQPPFEAANMAGLVLAHVSSPPPAPSATRPQVPKRLDEVIGKGMAKDPGARYATTTELAAAATNAITVPIAQPVPAPTPLPATQQAPTIIASQPDTVNAPPPAPAEPATVRAPSPVSTPPPTSQAAPPGPTVAAPLRPSSSTPPAPVAGQPQPVPPSPVKAKRVSRRTVGFIVGAGLLVTVIAAAVGIPALGKHGPSQSSPSSSPRSPGGQVVLPFDGLESPEGVAVDTTGNLYVTDTGNKRVVKLAAGSSAQTALPFTGLNQPEGVAVDGSGTVYVADMSNKRVLKLPAGATAPTELAPGPPAPPDDLYLKPAGLAVDGAGTLYVTENGVVSDTDRVWKLPAGSSAPESLPFSGLWVPYAVAVDTAGNVYVTDCWHHRVLKLTAGSSTPTELPFTGLNRPHGAALDAAGSLYVADSGNDRVLKLPAGSATWTVLPFTGLHSPTGVAVDTAGNLYVADAGNSRVLKLPAM